MTIKDDKLTIPHPEMANREFVLVPLMEIDADILIPGCGMASNLISRLDNHSINRI
jgi:2-amino-4-hydroxy-6-hydroxymethyldihydropteridine diphosphokinase